MTPDEFEAEYQEYIANLDDAIKEAENINAQGVGDDFVIPVSRTWSNEDYTLQLRSKTPVVPAMLNSTLSFAPCPHCGKFMYPQISAMQHGIGADTSSYLAVKLTCLHCRCYLSVNDTRLATLSFDSVQERLRELVERAKDQYTKNHH